MRKRSSYQPRLLTPGQITALSDQFICHPASRSIDDIEMAGEIMRDLLKQRDELLAAMEKCRKELSAWMRDHGDDIATQEAVADARAAIASVKGGAA